jgi:hypothetical protein
MKMNTKIKLSTFNKNTNSSNMDGMTFLSSHSRVSRDDDVICNNLCLNLLIIYYDFVL